MQMCGTDESSDLCLQMCGTDESSSDLCLQMCGTDESSDHDTRLVKVKAAQSYPCIFIFPGVLVIVFWKHVLIVYGRG